MLIKKASENTSKPRITNFLRQNIKNDPQIITFDTFSNSFLYKSCLLLVCQLFTKSFSPPPLGRPRTSDTFISRDSVMTESSTNSFSSKNLVLPKITTNEGDCDRQDRPVSVISNQDGRLLLSPLEALPEENNEVNFRFLHF